VTLRETVTQQGHTTGIPLGGCDSTMNGYDLTERVRMALAMAREQAARRERDQVCPEHILLALLDLDGSAGAKVLDSLDVKRDILTLGDPTMDVAAPLVGHGVPSERVPAEIERRMAAMPEARRRSEMAVRAETAYLAHLASAKRTRQRWYLSALTLILAAAALVLALARRH